MKKKTVAVLLICALFVLTTSGASALPKDTEGIDSAIGVIEESEYTNEYFGVGMELPEGWSFLTDEELAQMMNLSIEIVQDEDLAETMREQMEAGNAITNMAAKDTLGLRNLNMRLAKVEDKTMLSYSEEEILNLISGTVESGLEKAGYKNLSVKIEKTTFVGEEKPVLVITGEVYSIPVYQYEFLFLGEDYYAIVTYTSMLENHLEEDITAWYTLEEAEEEAAG